MTIDTGSDMELTKSDRITSEMKTGSRFVPLDLSPYANAGPHTSASGELLWGEGGPAVRRWPSGGPPDLEGFPVGQQWFHGIPFYLPDPAQSGGFGWLVLSEGAATFDPQITIRFPKAQRAASVIVAHFTDLALPEFLPGEVLATYKIAFADGESVEAPVRRQIEIAGRQATIGTQCYAALPHVEFRPARETGKAQDSRACFTGIETVASRQTYWLMTLENPCPHKDIVALELTARHPDLTVIGGITLSMVCPDPLRRGPREGIIIDLAQLEKVGGQEVALAAYPEDIEFVPVTGRCAEEVALAVDLGSITECTTLPGRIGGEWLAAPVKGWGAPADAKDDSLIYAQVTAASDAHLLLRRGTATHAFHWREILESGAGITLSASSWTRLTVRVVDADDGRELPSRIHFRGVCGEYLPPLGHSSFVNGAWGQHVGGDVKLGNMTYAYVPGRFDIMLPVGEVGVEAVHGFEYRVLRRTLRIEPGQSELVLELQRWSDIRQKGYFCGDVHTHFLDPVTAALETAAEDLNVINILAAQWGRSHTGVVHGISQGYDGGSPDRVVRVDSENRHHIMGDVFLLNLKDPVLPLSSGGAERDEIGGWEDSSLVDWCAACKAQGGYVFTQLTPTPHAEACAAIVLGLVDAVEVRWFDFGYAAHVQVDGHWGETPFSFAGVQQWYAYLNAGYRLPAIGGTDKMSNTVALGALRTYACLGEGAAFDYDAWCAAIANGRTFVSTGPTIEMRVHDKLPGDVVDLPHEGGTLHVTATARCGQPFDTIDLVQNGEVIAHAKADEDGLSARLDVIVQIECSSWLAVRCHGRNKLYTHYPIDIAAHTSPVYVQVGGLRQTSPTHARYLLSLIEGGIAYLDKLAVWRDEDKRHNHLARLEEGRQAILRDNLRDNQQL
ncbi:CehA/McbA family metallohydrolase [Paraburkholderia phenoliruptrix]|uniref:CehA/McbA family metallohydrolase n=1 Tax=Paraburkholderia phenoliruptrix TaxID=252970 RepID=UPI0028698D7A|nr:CehA/McbA family metallohydrolase [Paraburkholderia phenoliruptrix]WMY10987.1 CehA/McbA family metallohydrolase [Paraburkholderia phenoliruptrix]